MPKFLERKLRTEAASEGIYGRKADQYVYGTMNNIGAMKGNKETPKGAAMQAKHDAAPRGAQHPHKNLGGYLHAPKKR